MPISVRMRSRFSAGASAVIATAPPPITGWPLGGRLALEALGRLGLGVDAAAHQVAPAEHEEHDDAEQRVEDSEEKNSSVGLPARLLLSTTPLTIEPKMLIGEKPPAVAPLTTIRPISTGLIL